MATMTIDLEAQIHAEIITKSFALPNTPLIIDPLTNSYSDYAPLRSYRLSIVAMNGVYNPVLLQNGKNSRLTVSGYGSITIKLNIEDNLGNTDTDEVTINIG